MNCSEKRRDLILHFTTQFSLVYKKRAQEFLQLLKSNFLRLEAVPIDAKITFRISSSVGPDL